MKKIIKINIVSLLVFFSLIGLGFYNNLLAFVMDSGNYRLEVDDSSVAGGDWTSANYIFRDTMGEVSTGRSVSDSYGLRAGYQEMLESYLSVAAPGSVALAPAIPGVSGGTANGTGTWTIIVDNPAGFNMKIKASASTAMKLTGDPTYYFADYPTAVTYDWNVISGDARFGFTPEPAAADDTATAFKNDGDGACGTGVLNTADKCWSGLNGTSDITIINRATRTDIDGEAENIKFKAQSNAKLLKNGEYVATITTTVVSN